jgi:multiple antibiotic resistance protein
MAWHGFLLATAAGLLLVLVALRLVLAHSDTDDDIDDDHEGPRRPPPENPGLDLVVQPLVFPTILTPYGLAVVITLSALVSQVETTPLRLMIMGTNLLAMLDARPILAVIKPRVLQMLGIVLGIIQLALGIGLLFTAVEVQALAIKDLLH